ncbi:MAG TPA: Calx-beta domain-containing protein [Pyrinomonadaceae bacterium]|nr:Calx-beta domain-containing protein [Pyrinomonadaceae bacterium]
MFRSTDSGATWTTLNNFGLFSAPDVAWLAIDSTAPATIYAATQGSGLFKTTNGGSSWSAINNGISSGFGTNPAVIKDVVIDPLNSSTLYINVASSRINKSTNGGNSWSLVNNSAVVGGINALVATPSVVYAGTVGGGVIKTTDGGTNWTSLNTGLWTGIIRVLIRDPSNSAILYAGGSEVPLATDAFVAKLNSSGSELLFSTYLGGSLNDAGNGIAVDGSGNIYVTGKTSSTNFPTQNAFQSIPSPNELGGNAFVTKINPVGPSYVFSTYLGGSFNDEGTSIALDLTANVYVTGNTLSADFPIANAFQANIGDTLGGDAFVTKLNSSGSLSYSTYLGGSNRDAGFGIAVDVSGNAYVTGFTSSLNFPTVNPIQPTNGSNNDAFVTKLSSQGSALVYSTYLGGSNSDAARGIAVDANGNAYVTGFTSSQDFPLVAGALRTRSAMFKSVNAAVNWTNDNYGLPALVTQVVVHPTQPLTLYAGTGNGVFRSTDGGKTWSPINNGLAARLVVALVIDPLTPTTLYVAALDSVISTEGVYKSTDDGNSWNRRRNGITNTNLRSLAIDPVTPTTLYAGAFNGPIFKTTDGADNWAPSGNSPPFVPLSLAVDPHNPTRIFATESSNNAGVFRSIDSGATWQSVLSRQFDEGIWVGVSPHTPGLVYMSFRYAGLFKSVNGGDTWTLVRPGSGKIVFDPVSASTLYFVSSTEGLLKSTDSGQTWIRMNNGLPGKNVVDLAINPLRTLTLYLATASTHDEDAFVTKINPDGSALVYSTFVGGTQDPNDSSNLNDEAFAIAIDSAGNAYITGFARSLDFPTTPNAYQATNLGGFADTFISKLTMSFVIRGHVLDGFGIAVNGAEVALSDGTSLADAVVTGADGAYEFSHLREGGNYVVSAAKPHFTMAPPSQSFSNLTSDHVLNFTANLTDAPFLTISGQVTGNSVGLAGVTVTLSGSQFGTRTTDINGLYLFELPVGGNYTVTPSAAALTFGPASQTFNNLSAAQTANFAATRQSFVVTNANNHGAGSLREAITNANATTGADTIVFNIPGPGVKVISLLTPLPEVSDPVVIDASTQPGYAGAPLIELDGDNLGFESGLVITSGNTTVRGFAIGRFNSSGIVLRSCNNNVIQSNYIGIDATGNLPRPNGGPGILLSDSSNNVIGGTSVTARNVISRNSNGIEILGSGNVVQGNFIGTNAVGTAALGNIASGVAIPVYTDNLIGGNSAGVGNLISGNSIGISTSASGTTIQGNLIGTNVNGTSKIPNNSIGVQAIARNTLIGGLTPASRNIISGNGTGVVISGQGSKLQGNFIGTDITGTLALGNTFDGAAAFDGALIGGTVAEARNIIAGNEQSNVSLGFGGSSPGVIVQGNYIGTDLTGNRAISAFTISSGIAISGSNNSIGGLVPEARNVISGNAVGVQFRSANVGSPDGNVIQGNLIGLNAAGTAPLSNTQGGIEFRQGFNNVVGGTQSGAGNKIAFNSVFGVMVSPNALQNSIRGNSIFSNDGLGIDLGASGVTANDATDSDVGANNLQNFPVLSSVMSIGNTTTIQGSLKSTPNTTFRIDFYSNAALDPSGNGEGALFLNTTSITTDINGDATINVTFPVPLETGRVLTATATDPDGNTSEFSAGDVSSATGNLQFSVNSLQVIEDLGLLTITVLRKGGSTGSLTIDYATIDGTATAGLDYTATSGTLTFNAGETSKIIQIPILDDAVTELDENFTVVLRNGSSLEALGVPNLLVVTIEDRSTVPVISLSTPSIVEGNTGSTTEALLTFTLSAATGRLVTANYVTSNLSAFGSLSCSNQGTDYETISGTIAFQPGNTSVTVPVKICGDASAEANEEFRIDLSNPFNAVVGSSQAAVAIIDDDVLELLLEDSGPTGDRTAALDAFLFLRDPFRVVGPEWFPTGSDRNTRVMFFVRGLQLNPGESPSAVIVELRGSNNLLFLVLAQDVRSVPNVDFAQLAISLSNVLPANTYTVTVRAHSRTSNIGTIRIAP